MLEITFMQVSLIQAMNFNSKVHVFSVQRQEGSLRCGLSPYLMSVITRKSSTGSDASNESLKGFGCI